MTYLNPAQRYSAKMRDMTPYLDIAKLWEQGVHVASSGKQWNIADMPLTYLNNVINKFNDLGYDTTALQSYLTTTTNAPDLSPPSTGPTAQASL